MECTPRSKGQNMDCNTPPSLHLKNHTALWDFSGKFANSSSKFRRNRVGYFRNFATQNDNSTVILRPPNIIRSHSSSYSTISALCLFAANHLHRSSPPYRNTRSTEPRPLSDPVSPAGCRAQVVTSYHGLSLEKSVVFRMVTDPDPHQSLRPCLGQHAVL
jgi:hypothetical protein